MLIEIRRAHATRSVIQNALYWAGYVRPLADYTGYTSPEVHAYLKKRFLPNSHVAIADRNGVILDEVDLEPTTTRLTKHEFSEYLMHIAAFAAELGVDVGSDQAGA